MLEGAYLFPAIWKKNSHHPLVKWGTEASNDPKLHKLWKDQWPESHMCVALKQSGLTVLDVDNKNGKDGANVLFDLVLEFGDLPETLTVKTPSQGRHYLFKGISPTTTSKLGPGLDTPVMIPLPGETVSGKGIYEIIKEIDELPEVPAWISKKLGKVKPKGEHADEFIVEPDDEGAIARAIAYLKSTEPARQHENGNNRTFAVACRVRDFGISKPKCEELMLEYFYPRCEPNNKPEFITRMVENAYKYASEPGGNDSPEMDFEPVGDFAGVFKLNVFHKDALDRDWIVPGWMPKREITSLYGAGGGGKSLLALQLALSVSHGKNWLGMPTTLSNVLYISCEDTKDEMHRRFKAIQADVYYGDFIRFDHKRFVGWDRRGEDNFMARASDFKLHDGAFLKPLQNQLGKMKGRHTLLVLDTIADVYAGNENDRSMVNAFLKTVLGGLLNQFDLTILMIGHPSKGNGSAYSGSTAWDGGIRSRWLLTPHDDQALMDYRILEKAKSNYGRTGEEITLQWQNGLYVVADGSSMQEAVYNENSQIVLDAINELYDASGAVYGSHPLSTNPIFNADIRDSQGAEFERKTLDRILNRLQADKLIHIRSNLSQNNGIFPYHVYEEKFKDFDDKKAK